MMNRRNLLLSATLLTIAMAAPVYAADEPKLTRQHVDLVAPPSVHPHEQATKAGPKIIEFTLNIEEKKVVIDAEGYYVPGNDLQWLDARPADGRARG
jgi:nitrite reductase (NO-forming)